MGLRNWWRPRRYFLWMDGRFEEVGEKELPYIRRYRPVSGGMGDRFFNYFHINSNTDSLVSPYKNAILSTINVCTPWTTAGTATVYDAAVAGDEVAGNVIAVMSLLAAGGANPPSFIFDVVCRNNGLRIVTASGTPGDMTVSYS